MNTAGAMMMVVMLIGMSCVEGFEQEKRFVLDSAYDTAKEAANKVAPGVDFDGAVKTLIPYIHSDMSVFVCTHVCVGAAGSVLGPASALAPLVCPHLCEAALAKLEEEADATVNG